MKGRSQVARLQGEDVAVRRDRLSDLFETTFDDLFRFCLARAANRSAAEEAASEAFLAAARTMAAGNDAVDRAWLFVVARNRIIDGWRSAERQRRRLANLVALRRDVMTSDDLDGVGDAVVEVMHRLPERQRAALVLRYLDGCSVAEVADVLEVEYTAAESLLARGRRNFTANWKEQDV